MQIQLKSIPQVSWHAIGVLSFLLFFTQVIQGTSIQFASNILFFNLLLGTTFNFCGGLNTVFGWLLSLLAFRQVVLSQMVKVLFWQPADLNLASPIETSQVYAIGMGMICLSSLLIYKLNLNRLSLVKPHSPNIDSRLSTAVFVIGLVSSFLAERRGNAPLILTPWLNALSYVGSLMLLGLIFEAQRTLTLTKGRMLLSLKGFLMLCFLFGRGLLVASKQVMFEPLFSIFLVLLFNQVRLKKKEIFFVVFVIATMGLVLTPFSDHGRNLKYEKESSLRLSVLKNYFLKNFSSWENYTDYLSKLREETVKYRGGDFYFGEPLFLVDRLSLIFDADKMISYYSKSEPEGMRYLASQIFFLPRSLTGSWLEFDEERGSILARKIGIISEDDENTGVSFGAFAEAYAIGKWWGLIWLALVVYTLFQWGLALIDVSGNSRVWSIFLIVYLQQVATETGVLGNALLVFRMIPLLFLVKKALELLENQLGMYSHTPLGRSDYA